MKESAGKMTGARSQELKGNLEKIAGKVQEDIGKATDDVRGTDH